MKLLVLGGTTDTRKYLETCKDDFIITVATEYGFQTFDADYPSKTVQIRFSPESMQTFIREHKIEKIIDTTHPFAKEITKNAIETANKLNIPYESHMRQIEPIPEYEKTFICETYEEAVNYLAGGRFNSILLTTGSNNICAFKDIIEKCYVRILPYEKSIAKCREAGVEYKKIIAMQGPFSADFNEALMSEINADALVTKMSGETGGLSDKIEACKRTKAACVIITSGF